MLNQWIDQLSSVPYILCEKDSRKYPYWMAQHCMTVAHLAETPEEKVWALCHEIPLLGSTAPTLEECAEYLKCSLHEAEDAHVKVVAMETAFFTGRRSSDLMLLSEAEEAILEDCMRREYSEAIMRFQFIMELQKAVGHAQRSKAHTRASV